MYTKVREAVIAGSCFGLSACAPAKLTPPENVFVTDPCAPEIILERVPNTEPVLTEDGYVMEVYRGTEARLPEGCA